LHLASIPPIDAVLNGSAAILLLMGFYFITRRRIVAHKICMVSAFLCSAAFLSLYLYFHYHAGVIRFSGQGWIRPVYFAILISHTVLAVVSLPLILITLTLALRDNFAKHHRIARWTFPIWLYVSLTGVIVYWLLFIVYTPIGAPA
jgi:putative membrane protein